MKCRLFLASLASLVLMSEQANAAKLESWYFDQAQNQLHITTDSGIQPKAFLLDNPKRLVIDLPGTTIDTTTMR